MQNMNKNIKKFDENYVLLEEIFEDDYYPKFLVEKVEKLIRNVIEFLETGENDVEIVQKKLDEMTIGINDLEDEFYENESEIETVARDSIGVTVEYVLKWFGIDIDIEEAIREREW